MFDKVILTSCHYFNLSVIFSDERSFFLTHDSFKDC